MENNIVNTYSREKGKNRKNKREKLVRKEKKKKR